MKLGSIRELSELKKVLKDPESLGPDPVYWVFNDVTTEKWANITVLNNGLYNGEFPKTYGHYHAANTPETYHVIEGEGVAVLQKKHLEAGKWDAEMVDKIYLIRMKTGDEITYGPEYGHSLSNTGKIPLITYDDWRSGHSPLDYEPIERLQGLAYYLVEEDGEIKAVPNPNYQHSPEPIWVSASEFRELSEK